MIEDMMVASASPPRDREIRSGEVWNASVHRATISPGLRNAAWSEPNPEAGVTHTA
jgi:hypothetical protein